MNELHNKLLTPNARKLRHNMTSEELHLWLDFFKKIQIVVKRQKPIGKYIVDFYIPCAKLVVELDGSQHGKMENREADMERDSFLLNLGITVLRYKNTDINNNFRGVCRDICSYIPNLNGLEW